MRNKKRRGPGQCARALALAAVLILAGMGGSKALKPIQAEAAQETVTYESPVFTGDGETFRPKEMLERDGKQYRLVSTRIKSAVKEGVLTYASASVPYALEGNQEPPETAWITIKDDSTGKEYEREVPRQELVEKSSYWEDDFKFLVSVSGYDADSFWIGETELPADAELSEYGNELLDFLELPKDCYRVEAVVWIGESYEKDGILCRDAEARGSRLIRNVEVKYGGQVRTPEVKGKQYIGIYEELMPETEESREEQDTAGIQTEEKETVSEEESSVGEPEAENETEEGLLYWIKNHLTIVSVGGGFLLLLLAAGLLLWMSARKREGSLPEQG